MSQWPVFWSNDRAVVNHFNFIYHSQVELPMRRRIDAVEYRYTNRLPARRLGILIIFFKNFFQTQGENCKALVTKAAGSVVYGLALMSPMSKDLYFFTGKCSAYVFGSNQYGQLGDDERRPQHQVKLPKKCLCFCFCPNISTNGYSARQLKLLANPLALGWVRIQEASKK